MLNREKQNIVSKEFREIAYKYDQNKWRKILQKRLEILGFGITEQYEALEQCGLIEGKNKVIIV